MKESYAKYTMVMKRVDHIVKSGSEEVSLSSIIV